MKTLVMVAMGVCLGLAAGAAARAGTPAQNKQTLEDLQTAMRGEAFAYARYMLYAQHARQRGNEELAKLFEGAAQTEHFEHFREQAKLAGLPGSDAENLRDAIKGETYETQTMYPEFARRASAVGDAAAAKRFEEVGRDELKHRNAFQAALDKLERAPAKQ